MISSDRWNLAITSVIYHSDDDHKFGIVVLLVPGAAKMVLILTDLTRYNEGALCHERCG